MNVTAKADPGAELVHYGANYAVPERFTATVEPDDPSLPICHLIVAMENGHPVCEELCAQRRAGERGITGTALRRIPLGEYVKLAVGAAASWKLPAPEGTTLTWNLGDGETAPVQARRIDRDWVALPVVGLERSPKFHAETQTPRPRPSGGRVTDDVLQQVADTYRAALAAKEPPTAAVAAALPVSRSTAGRYVQRAREKGLLGPTRPRVASE